MKLQHKRLRWSIFVALVAVILFAWPIGDSQMLGRYARCMVTFLQDNNGAIAAIATVVMAIFTYFLYRSTEKLWKAGQDALKATERAFIFLDGFNVELTTLADTPDIEIPEALAGVDKELHVTRFAAQPKWRNGGNTPTKHLTIRVNWRGPTGPIPPDYVYRNAAEPFFLAPKAVEPSTFVEMPGAQALIDYGINPIGVEPMLFIWGRADYEDVFGQPHFVEWCYRVRFARPDGKTLRVSFIQWGEYNCSE